MLNILKYYGFIDGEPKLPQRQVIITGLCHFVVTKAVLCITKRTCMIRLKRINQLQKSAMSLVICGKLSVLLKVAFFWSRPVYPMVASGESVGKIGIPSDYI